VAGRFERRRRGELTELYGYSAMEIVKGTFGSLHNFLSWIALPNCEAYFIGTRSATTCHTVNAPVSCSTQSSLSIVRSTIPSRKRRRAAQTSSWLNCLGGTLNLASCANWPMP
jgi:hypothetical protein